MHVVIEAYTILDRLVVVARGNEPTADLAQEWTVLGTSSVTLSDKVRLDLRDLVAMAAESALDIAYDLSPQHR